MIIPAHRINQLLSRNQAKRTFGTELINIQPPEIQNYCKPEPMRDDPPTSIVYQMLEPRLDPTADYQSDIFNNLIANENKYTAHPNYMARQTDINEKMRAILIDWLVEVHLKFKLLPETLYLTVSLIDRYLEKTVVKRQKLQLVGITALLIACKYEEIYAPEMKDLVYITDKAYEKQEILEMEMIMLQTLEFNITMPSSWRFLQYFGKLLGYEKGVEFYLSQYLMELSLLDLSMLKYSPSHMACGALYLTMKITKKNVKWPSAIKYSDMALRQCACDLIHVLKNSEKNDKGDTLRSLKKKFSAARYSEVSNIKLELN
jgi:G2/mitotic-specific cyclin-B, other